MNKTILSFSSKYKITSLKFELVTNDLVDGSLDRYYRDYVTQEIKSWQEEKGRVVFEDYLITSKIRLGVFPDYVAEIQVVSHKYDFLIIRFYPQESCDDFLRFLPEILNSKCFDELFEVFKIGAEEGLD